MRLFVQPSRSQTPLLTVLYISWFRSYVSEAEKLIFPEVHHLTLTEYKRIVQIVLIIFAHFELDSTRRFLVHMRKLLRISQRGMQFIRTG